MNKRTKWILGTSALLVALVGGTMLWAALKYDPLLFAVNGTGVRVSEWEQLKVKIFNGVNYTHNEEVEALMRRSMEELVLAKAKQAGIQADEAAVQKQFETLGATPEARAEQLKQMNTTEAEVLNNYRRAMTAFQLKAQVTRNVQITDQEVTDEYAKNKTTLYYAPEYRSIYYLQANAGDAKIAEVMKTANEQNFPEIAKTYTSAPPEEGHISGWHELIGQEHLATHMTPKVAAEAFKAPVNKLIGPIRDNNADYWFQVSEIKPPKQFSLMEVNQKIRQNLLMDKQITYYRQWLDGQKASVGYYYDPDNLERGRLTAFWHDLPENWKLWF